MPSWEPIVGSGFDQIGEQRFRWNQSNQAVEQANLQRAAQADEAQNRWRSQAAQFDQSEAQRADAASERSWMQDAQARRDAEGDRRFNVETGQRAAQQGIENKRWDFSISERNRLEKKQLDEAENLAKARADEVDKAGEQADLGEATYNAAQARHQKAIAEASALAPAGYSFNYRTNLFVPGKQNLTAPTPDEAKKLAQANQRVAESFDELRSASQENQQAAGALNAIRQEFGPVGLTIAKQGDKWRVFSRQHNKWFGPNPSVASVTADPPTSRFAAGAEMPSWLQQSAANNRFQGETAAPDLGTPSAADVIYGRGPDGSLVPLQPGATPTAPVSSIERSRNARWDGGTSMFR